MANVLPNAVAASVILLELLAADLLLLANLLVLEVGEELDNLELIGGVFKVLILLVLLRAGHLAKGGEGLLGLDVVVGSGGGGGGGVGKRLLLDELLTLAQVANASESILRVGIVVAAGLGVEVRVTIGEVLKGSVIVVRFLLPPVAPIASPPAWKAVSTATNRAYI